MEKEKSNNTRVKVDQKTLRRLNIFRANKSFTHQEAINYLLDRGEEKNGKKTQ